MMSNDVISHEKSYRQSLSVVVASLCLEANYDSAEEAVMETLTELLQSYISEVASTTRLFCEHSGRTLPTGRDVMCALADMGFNCQRLPEYLRRSRRINLGQISKTVEAGNAAVLQVGKRKGFSSYISDNYNYPQFPDPHAYIRTTTGQKSSSDYVVLRERLSEQRRDVERALTRFVAKTGDSLPLLSQDKNAFPLIAAAPTSLPYLAALLPPEHEALSYLKEDEDKETGHETPSKKSSDKKSGHGDDDVGMTSREQAVKHRVDDVTMQQSSVIRNPYLRPVKKQKMKRKLQ